MTLREIQIPEFRLAQSRDFGIEKRSGTRHPGISIPRHSARRIRPQSIKWIEDFLGEGAKAGRAENQGRAEGNVVFREYAASPFIPAIDGLGNAVCLLQGC